MDDRLFENLPPRRPATDPRTVDTRQPRRRREKVDPSFERTSRFYQHQLPEAQPDETHFRHSHWNARRQRIRAMLTSAGASAHQLNRWDACGGQCTVEWSASLQKHRLRANYCKSRHCEPCMRAKANTIARNLRDRLDQERKARSNHDPIGIRFVTLTLRHSDEPLADQIKHLYKSFTRLRSQEGWKDAVDGGAATLEVKRAGRHWHPHLHVVTAGRFLDRRQLSEMWKLASGGSFIVDIRALNDVADACHYVSKYITKGTSPNVWDNDDTAQEWITASKGVRICNTFGTWRGFKLLNRTSDVEDWKPVGTLTQIIAAARLGDAWALGVMLELRPPGRTDELPPPTHPPP